MARNQSEAVRDLIALVKKSTSVGHPLKLEEFSNGHFRITGNTVVDYWPDSKMRTAYTKSDGKRKHVLPAKAVEMAMQGEPRTPKAPKVQPEEVCRDLQREPFPELQEAARAMMKKHNINPKR